MNNKLANCTAAGSSTQRLKEEGSMVTRSFSSHLSVHIYYTDLCTHSLYRRCVYTRPKKGSRCSYTGSFYSYLLSVCVLYIHIFHIIHIMFTKSLYKHIYALYTIIIQESIQKQLCQLIDYLKRVRFFERRGRVLKRPSVLPSVGNPRER